MDNGKGNLISAMKLLNSSVEKSKILGQSLEKCCPRLDEINHRLLSVEVAIRPVFTQTNAASSVGAHINRAVVPAVAVLKVFDAIHGLEKSLSDPQSDLPGYLGVLKRLEEALRFLAENCAMAIQWLSDVVEHLEDHKLAGGWFCSRLKKALKSLQRVEIGEEKDRLDGGFLEVALDRLENEFQRLLAENSFPLPAFPDKGERARIKPSPLPVSVIQKLQAILGRLIVNHRLDKCVSIYVEVRSANIQASMQPLDLDYLEMSVSEFNTVSSTEVYISLWCKHLEFTIKHLFEAEYKLCNDVFVRTGSNVWKNCFAELATRAGMLAFLKFGKTIAESKEDPIKLLNLLDVFATLNKLRSNFNRLFGTDACAEIQNMTRELIKSVIEGSCMIFLELSVEVERQRHTAPPPDCGVPRVVSFINGYCNKILRNDYKMTLIQVMTIERSWKREKYEKKILIGDIVNLVKSIELNLDTWSKGYEKAPSYLFLMNNHWYLYKYLKGTKLGGLLGESWLLGHKHYKEHYLTMYLRESWGQLPAQLSREGLIMFSGERETARGLVKQRLRSFNAAFDDMCKRQSNWVIPDKELRERTCQAIIQTVVPAYRSYMQNYGPLVEQETNANQYVRYTTQSLENILGSLFHRKPGGFQSKQLSGGLSNDVVDQRPQEGSPTME